LPRLIAKESLALAEAMQCRRPAAYTDPSHLPELLRFVSDSRIYVLATLPAVGAGLANHPRHAMLPACL
jgi:hypothetical protein